MAEGIILPPQLLTTGSTPNYQNIRGNPKSYLVIILSILASYPISYLFIFSVKPEPLTSSADQAKFLRPGDCRWNSYTNLPSGHWKRENLLSIFLAHQSHIYTNSPVLRVFNNMLSPSKTLRLSTYYSAIIRIPLALFSVLNLSNAPQCWGIFLYFGLLTHNFTIRQFTIIVWSTLGIPFIISKPWWGTTGFPKSLDRVGYQFQIIYFRLVHL